VKERTFVPTGARWASTVGYARAVRVGEHVYVSGTAAVGADGKIVHPKDAYLQAKRCLEIIADALQQLGAAPRHVIRTRMYALNPNDWEAIGRAHGEVFGDVLPATTMVFTGFIDPDMLVEIEAEAIVD
jgi:enamine deaminase RidA (YjgF/YER057c/UK114 family)